MGHILRSRIGSNSFFYKAIKEFYLCCGFRTPFSPSFGEVLSTDSEIPRRKEKTNKKKIDKIKPLETFFDE